MEKQASYFYSTQNVQFVDLELRHTMDLTVTFTILYDMISEV